MHNIWLIQRRFPRRSGMILAIALVLSLSALLIGIGLLLLA